MQQRRTEEGGPTRDEAGALGPMSDSGAYRSQKIILLLYETLVDPLHVPTIIVLLSNSIQLQFRGDSLFICYFSMRVKMFEDVWRCLEIFSPKFTCIQRYNYDIYFVGALGIKISLFFN